MRAAPRVGARRALGNFAVSEVIAWTGAPLRRLAAPSPPPWDRGRRLCRFSISTALWRDLLEGGATLRRSPPGQYIALQPRVVPAGRLQRALGDGELDALALKARVELIDAPFGLGAIGSGVDLDFGDAVGQQLYLLLGVRERGLARLSTSPPRCSTVPSATPAPARARGPCRQAHRA